jgi:hypothetical protein
VLAELKSTRSRRVVAVPPPLVAALRLHHAAQFAERMAAGPAWQDNDLVWCQANGRPIKSAG